MSWISRILGNEKTPSHSEQLGKLVTESIGASAVDYYHKPYLIQHEPWDGERHWGELGAPRAYRADFYSLAMRSWQSYYESDITQIIVGKYLLWVVGKGLELNSEPLVDVVLKKYPGFANYRDSFSSEIEDLWWLHANSKESSLSRMQTLNEIAYEAELNAVIGGDVLVLSHYDGKQLKTQLVDGLHVSTPVSGDWVKEAQDRGNEIRNGVEIDSKGEHIAFYIKGKDLKHSRVEALNVAGRRVAWLLYGNKYRIDDTRGMPLMGVVLEELSKLGRYKDATLASAEENAKIAFSIEHNQDSTGENPLLAQMRAATRSGMPVVPETATGDFASAKQIAMTTQKQVFNMEPGSKLVPHKNEAPNNFKDFFTTNFEIVCAALGIPPEVALNKYNSNYSASRMAVKSWEYKFMTDREAFGLNFYKPVYTFWLDISVLKGLIISADYDDAMRSRNTLLLDAFRNCAFIGPGMPHIDPVKEAKAEEIKLNNLLTTREKSTRDLGDGDWYQNIENRKREEDKLEQLGLKQEPEQPDNTNGNE